MPRRTVPLIADHYYHVYNRGNNREPMFLEAQNYGFFLRRFREHVANDHADVIAYVLMPNHFHFLLKTKTDELSSAMQRFGISYTKGINESFGRVGHLFQGPFQAKLVDDEVYLIHLTRYLHLNPMRCGLVQCAEDWAYSSYREFIGLRRGTLPHPSTIWQEFGPQGADVCTAQRLYREFVASYRLEDRKAIAHLLIG